ncbi:D-alanyl-D-alanine carboxypeptidase [Moraxella atlantae]|uniref:D-alanyl-D-alanine carboxypeptidase n=1 Tax=Faucicola atlantae TaxID=34059 RepID=A0A1B8QK65_9GAMM|nr:serine hydrolase [Moraxella atlantae]OBX80546.1 D-alanyl-D-alanine carboxypeptidase [Moraxella atlantae]OBX83936.1 D-alanyl-D-alanine carboxypeptidase [Moraxella atlantae]OPH36339.1 D-alanyl-D-alanine carboxypeptidase [Moraxella atlantae]STY95613.1 D-alanyl-D-alanine endopeptidase precursor [Moraxella atlantae]
MKTILNRLMAGALLAALSISAQADLVIHSGGQTNSTGQGRVAWGGENSLNKARAIMYSQPTYNTTYNSYSTANSGWSEEDNFSPSWQAGSTRATGNYYAASKGALVMDALSGQILYEKNADIARPIASISKLMTAILVAESGADMNEMLTVDSLDFKTPKKSGSDRLKVGDQLNRAEMLLMMLMKSENPAAKALARTDPMGYDAFIARMNAKARELGMTQTEFYDPSGLDSRNVASPRDLAQLVRYAYQHNLVRSFSTTPNRDFYVNNLSSGFRSISARSTNYMVRDGLYSLGLSKTGYIREAGNCVVFETNVGSRPTIVVLLGATDSKMRWNDAENIIANLSMRKYT